MSEALAEKTKLRFDALKSKRSCWDGLWQDIARYVMPRRVPGIGTVESPSTENEARLFDTTAVHANLTLANGQLAWMSPMESAWFTFEPVEGREDDSAKTYLAGAAAAARKALARSNFYTAVHEFYLDRSAFGTACLYIERGKRKALNARVWPVGTFVIDEDDEGDVDTVIREMQLTARQAVQMFGEEGVHEKVRRTAGEGGDKALEKVTYLHAIRPREDAERDGQKLGGENMPIASVYVDTEHNHVCRNSGYEEMPVFVSRYLEWGSGLGGLYGWSPSFAALPEARQVNFLQKMMDALGEKMAFPPVLAPDELEGEIDPNAHGVTYLSQDLGGDRAPREWMTAGRYDIGKDRVEERQNAIDRAFHVELFQMFAQLDKQMTAREVAERSQEKLIQFSPTFARLTTELFDPMLERVFGLLARNGGIERPEGGLESYNIAYSSRIALALNALPSIGYGRTLERLSVTAQIRPDVLDNFDFDRAERDAAIADGCDPDILVPEKDRDEVRQARAEAEQAAEQRAQELEAADAVGKVGRVPGDSPVGKAMADGLEGAA